MHTHTRIKPINMIISMGAILTVLLIVAACGTQSGYIVERPLNETQRAVVNTQLPVFATGEAGEMAGQPLTAQTPAPLNSTGMEPAPTDLILSETAQIERAPATPGDPDPKPVETIISERDQNQ